MPVAASGDWHRRAFWPWAVSSFSKQPWPLLVSSNRICSEWVDEWPDLIEAHDPDITLLYVDGWPSEDQEMLKSPGVEPRETIMEVMSSGMEVLTKRGAPVAWASTRPSHREGIQRSRDPFHLTMQELRRIRSDLRLVGGIPYSDDPSAPVFVQEVADVLHGRLATYRRRAVDDKGRVMIVGDSQAQSVGFGLERWSVTNDGPAVWSAGVGGCGLVIGGDVLDLSSGEPGPVRSSCNEAIDNWAEGVKSFDPDRVLVLTSFRDLQPRLLERWSDFATVGDPLLDAHVLDSYSEAIEMFSSEGAEVVWFVPPCPGRTSSGFRGDGSPFDPSVLGHLHDQLLPALGDDHPDVEFFDLDEILCPAGSPLEEVDGVGTVRPDGLHLTPTASAWLAEMIGPELLDLEL